MTSVIRVVESILCIVKQIKANQDNSVIKDAFGNNINPQ